MEEFPGRGLHDHTPYTSLEARTVSEYAVIQENLGERLARGGHRISL
jgi:hypothetical protein